MRIETMKRKLYFEALLGLFVMAGLVMGLKYFGYEKVQGYTAATAASETITAANGQTFTWPTFTDGARHVIICNAPTSSANLYVKLNATTCNPSASGFDFILEPGQTWAGFAGTALSIEEVTLYADGAVTVGTHVTVNGVN
jgi:hypothetical protein